MAGCYVPMDLVFQATEYLLSAANYCLIKILIVGNELSNLYFMR